MNTTPNTQEIKSWITSASPEDLLAITKSSLTRVSQLDQNYRDQFTQSVKSEPSIARLLTPQTV